MKNGGIEEKRRQKRQRDGFRDIFKNGRQNPIIETVGWIVAGRRKISFLVSQKKNFTYLGKKLAGPLIFRPTRFNFYKFRPIPLPFLHFFFFNLSFRSRYLIKSNVNAKYRWKNSSFFFLFFSALKIPFFNPPLRFSMFSFFDSCRFADLARTIYSKSV